MTTLSKLSAVSKNPSFTTSAPAALVGLWNHGG
jgi:hypothetical protein